MTKKERDKKYYLANKEKMLAKNKANYEANKERHKQKAREWQAANKNKVAEISKRWREANPDYNKAYRSMEENKQRRNQNERMRRATDPAYKAICNVRTRQHQVLKGHISTTQHLGCTTDVLKEYLQSKFIEGMSWDNYGHGEDRWVIDHIVPLDSCHKTDTGEWDPISEYNKRLIHYTNLQPLWFIENAEKGAKI